MTVKALHDVIDRISSAINGYESPAEEILGERIRASLLPGVRFETQHWVKTSAGEFRIDIFLVGVSGKRIAIEVDGRSYHDPERDFWRSVMILGDDLADSVYRVWASELRSNLIGILASFAKREGCFFLPEATAEWRKATSVTYKWANDEESDEISDSLDEEDEKYHFVRRPHTTWLMELSREFPNVEMQRDWRPFYNFAKSSGLSDIDAIRRRWEYEHPK